MREKAIIGIKNRVLQALAMSLPGGGALRVALHRLRGVKIGDGVWIGSEALIETACPEYISARAQLFCRESQLAKVPS